MERKRTRIIAEAGVNHNGSIDLAIEMVDVAAEAGADFVKFQIINAEALASVNAPKAEYQIRNDLIKESQYDMLKRLELKASEFHLLSNYCQKKGVAFLASPFDTNSVDFLIRDLNLNIIKIPSGEITHGLLLLCAARSGAYVILSTGMSTLAEIEQALSVLAFGYLHANQFPSKKAFQEAYCSMAGYEIVKNKVTLLQCTTSYPTNYRDVNLLAMDTMHNAFGLDVGLSDHTLGIAVPIAAVARGATIIEKHFTLARSMEGPDHAASLEPHELKAMITTIRQVEESLGTPRKVVYSSEMGNRNIARKSLMTVKKIQKNSRFTENNIIAKRPDNGRSPMDYWNILHTRANRNYEKEEVLE